MMQLNECLAGPMGKLIRVVLDLDFAIQVGIGPPLTAIMYTEFLLLRQFAEERMRWQIEESKKPHG